MRWVALFQDFEAQLEASELADRSARVTELTRAETGGVQLVDRVRASIGARARIRLVSALDIACVIEDVALQWLLGAGEHGQVLIPFTAIDLIEGLSPRAVPQRSGVAARLGLGHVLRALARDRALVRMQLVSGECVGRVERVGGDHLELLVSAHGERVIHARGLVVVPFRSILCVGEVSQALF